MTVPRGGTPELSPQMIHGIGSRQEDCGTEPNNRIRLLDRMKGSLPVGAAMVMCKANGE